MARIGGKLDISARLKLSAFRLGCRLAPHLSSSLAYEFADRLGDLFWILNRRGRRAVESNLAQVQGRRPSAHVVRQVFRHGARNYYDTVRIPTLSAEQLFELVQVADWSPLEQALAAGRGAIMVGVHISSVALAGQVVAARGYAVTSVAERVEPAELDRLLTRLRSAGGVRVLSLRTDLMKELLAVLRRNEVVGLVMDRDIAGTGVRVDFFGAACRLPGGAAVLALRTGAPVLPAVAVRKPDGTFAGYIEQPVTVPALGDLKTRIETMTRSIAARFEHFIGQYPDQWTVFQPLWPGPSRADDRMAS